MSRTDLIRIKTVSQLYSLNNYFQTFFSAVCLSISVLFSQDNSVDLDMS